MTFLAWLKQPEAYLSAELMYLINSAEQLILSFTAMPLKTYISFYNHALENVSKVMHVAFQKGSTMFPTPDVHYIADTSLNLGHF